MDPTNPKKQVSVEEPRLLDFPHLPDDARTADGKPRLNKYSSTITKDHDFPGAQVIFISKRSNSLLMNGRQCCTLLVYQTKNQ